MEGNAIKRYALILFLLIPCLAWAGAPSRTYTYTSGDTISPSEVTANEDNIFRYLQTGVDTYLDNSIISADIYDGTITNSDISTSAAIAYSKLSLSGAILNSDIISAAGIPYSKLSLGSSLLSTDIKDNEILNADINASAAIVDTKLAQITTASKVSGAALTALASIPAGAGQAPFANLGKGAASSATYLTGDGAWTTIPTPLTQVNDTDTGTDLSSTSETTFLTKDKSITSGNTVLLIASGYIKAGAAAAVTTIKLKHGSTTAQTVVVDTIAGTGNGSAWSCNAIVTGLSGSTTFSVTAQASASNPAAYGNITVLEF